MPADRFLHPRCGHSEKVTTLTDLEYRVWTQYLLSSDDFGVMRALPAQLQADNDHLLTRPVKLLQRCLDVLVTIGLLQRFEHQRKPYLFQRDWQKWQKVEYPRATLEPMPPPNMLEMCDDDTRRLFALHPGGKGEKFKKAPEKIPKPPSEQLPNDEEISATNAGAHTREVANGLRPVANGLEGSPRETNPLPPMDEWFQELAAAYPAQAVSTGWKTQTAFVDAVKSQGSPHVTFTVMLGNLENHKQGYQWRVKRMIPRLDNWLRDGLWKQQHDADPPAAEQVTAKTNRTLTAAANIMREGR